MKQDSNEEPMYSNECIGFIDSSPLGLGQLERCNYAENTHLENPRDNLTHKLQNPADANFLGSFQDRVQAPSGADYNFDFPRQAGKRIAVLH